MIGFATFVGLTWITYAISGWVRQLMWKWHVVTVFPGLPLLTIPQAVGIVMVVVILTHPTRTSDFEEPTSIKTFIGALLMNLVYPALVLVTGWFLHLSFK